MHLDSQHPVPPSHWEVILVTVLFLATFPHGFRIEIQAFSLSIQHAFHYFRAKDCVFVQILSEDLAKMVHV